MVADESVAMPAGISTSFKIPADPSGNQQRRMHTEFFQFLQCAFGKDNMASLPGVKALEANSIIFAKTSFLSKFFFPFIERICDRIASLIRQGFVVCPDYPHVSPSCSPSQAMVHNRRLFPAHRCLHNTIQDLSTYLAWRQMRTSEDPRHMKRTAICQP